MNRAPDSLAPSWLPRQQRRYVDQALHKLIRSGVRSICGGKLKHNTRTTGGRDAQSNVVLAGECCTGRVAVTFVQGVYSDRNYDFLHGPKPSTENKPSTNIEPTNEQIADAIALHQKTIAETGKWLDGVERRGGARTSRASLLDSPWKDDDHEWFEQNAACTHRMRMPFPGEFDEEAAKVTAARVLIVLVRQVAPGSRIRAGLFIGTDWLPLPNEAVAHALFEVATRREPTPPDVEALDALIRKYTVRKETGQ